MNEGTLHHWFKGSKSKSGKPGWVQADGSPCANEPGETKTPKCFSSGRLKALKKKGKKGESLIRSAVRRKREKDKNQQSKSGASKPTMVKTFAKGKKDPNYIKAEPGIKESMEINEAKKDKPGTGSGKKDACYYKVKSRYNVWPSAYASGALVKCRKVGASNWGESVEMIRYCPKCKKEETRKECKYGEKFWDLYSMPIKLKDYTPNTPHPGTMPESKDHEYSMARSQISTIISAAKRLRKKMKGEGNIEAWVQSKLTKAADYIDSAADYVDSGEMNVEEHRLDEIAPLAAGAIAAGIAATPFLLKKFAKPAADKALDQQRKKSPIGGERYNNMRKESKTFSQFGRRDIKDDYVDSGEMSEQVKPVEGPYDKFDRLVNASKIPSNKKTKLDILKRASKIYPKLKESVGTKVKLKSGSGLGGGVQVYPRGNEPIPRKPGEEPQLPQFSGFVKKAKSQTKKEPQISHYVPEGEYFDEKCWDGYEKKGMKKMFGKKYPNCVKKEEYSNWRKDFGLSEDWQKVNRKDKTDGLSQKAVNAYRRENPGSKLQTAVTEKNPKGKRAKRRSSFCSRMKGMKSKLTSSKTARDPDSKINKALRRWRCS